jgi:hypothetical protein
MTARHGLRSLRAALLGLAVSALCAACSLEASQPPGGALGRNVGADLKPMAPMTMDMRAGPMNWCRESPEPSRCEERAAMEHQMCMGVEPAHYASCRFALDQMHGQ